MTETPKQDGEDMVERVARAIAAADGNDWDVMSGSYHGREQQMFYARQVRAAIAAMREPTEAMLVAARDWSAEIERLRDALAMIRQHHVGDAASFAGAVARAALERNKSAEYPSANEREMCHHIWQAMIDTALASRPGVEDEA